MAILVGRDAELARLRTLLDEAAHGRAIAALVSGDAGVGKSRLVAEVAALAAERGFTVLTGQCAEIGDSVPYLPFADALRTAPPELEAAVKARPVLARLLPDSSDGQRGEGDWAGLTRQQMFGAVLGLLTELAADKPVLLVLEDLHWADASTRELVTFLLRMLHRERVATIGTYRADDLHRRHPLRLVLADLQRLPSVVPVELGPMSPSALAEHLSAIRNGRGWLPAATLNHIVERAEGNAYYAEELLAAATASGPSGALPSGLAALLLSRVERVSDAAQQVLRAAAVAGRRASDELVRAASGLPDVAYDEAVREAVAHQLLAPDGMDGYTFRHALMREAVYNDLLPGERTRLHGRLAALLSDVPGAAAELAHHSLASHDVPGAFAASVRAGEEAERIGAPAEAHQHYDQALALWDRVDEPATLAGMSRGKLGHRSAAAAAASGDVPRAVHLLRRIRALLPDDPTADAGLRSRVGERLAYFLLQIEDREAFAEALRVAEQTVTETPAEPPTWYHARAMATYAFALMVAARQPRGPRMGRAGPRGRGEFRRAVGRGGRAGHARPAEQPVRRGGRGDRHVHRRARPGGGRPGPRRRTARRLQPRRRAPRPRRAHRGGDRGAPGRAAGGRGGAGPRAVRPGPAAPALPGALRRRGAGTTRRSSPTATRSA